MGFRDHVATAFGHLHTAFGADDEVGEITWDPDGADITCNAIVGSVTVEATYDEGEDHIETRFVTVQTADIASPQVGTFVVIDSVRYKVVSVPRVGFGSAQVKVARKDLVAKARPEHTKRMV